MGNTSFLFVINPMSGTSDKENLDEFLTTFCKKHEFPFSILQTTGNDDPATIQSAIKQQQPDIIIAGGGDGTVNLVAEQIVGSGIKLAILPLGSANGLATELKIPVNWEENLALLIQPKLLNIHAVRINDLYLSLHLSDIGFNADLIKEFEKEGQRGKLGYARSFFKKLTQRKVGRFKIETKDVSVRHKAEMIVIANGSSYGSGAIVNPRCDLEDNLFEVCIFKPLPWYKFLELTWHSFAGRLEESQHYAIYQTDEVTITSTKSHTLQVDGEVIGTMHTVTAKIVKEALILIVP